MWKLSLQVRREKRQWGGRRWNKDDLGISSMCFVYLACGGHEGQQHSLPEMKAGEPKTTLEIVWGVRFQCSHLFCASIVDPLTLQGEYESLLTLEGLQTTVSQCLQKLQLLRAGETVPVFVALCHLSAGHWTKIIFLLIILITMEHLILWWQTKLWYLCATPLFRRDLEL